MHFWIVDVFAEERYAGNQLAVVRAATGLTDGEMQSIAREFNFSETTFIMSGIPRDGGYDVRIFTPGAEVPFAGHPTLGTAYVIQREIAREPVKEIVLNLGVGQVSVAIEYAGGEPERLTMTQKEPSFGAAHDMEEVARVLGLAVSDIDERFPIEEVSTGLPFIIVPLKGLAAIKSIRVDKERYFTLVENAEAKALLVFSPEPNREENDISVRMFADFYGIPEDPATGSGCGALAAYLARHSCFGTDSVDIRAEQGFEIGRPSLLHLQAGKREGRISVRVGGKVISVASGILEG